MADELIESAAERLGYVLKEEQRKVVSSLVSSEDVFGILLTGYGKSLCYTTQPHLKALQATPSYRTTHVYAPVPTLLLQQGSGFA